MRQRVVSILPALFTLLLAMPAARAATVNVSAVGFSFEPATVNINVGDTVVWSGLDGGFHNVAAEDGSFRSPGGANTFSRTFNSAGSFDYACEPHLAFGMTGTVNVSGGGGEQRGSLNLSGTVFSVTEGNSVNLQVQRVGGDDGAVSVSWSVTAGTAQAADFTAANGTLTWADNDDNPKTLTIVTNEDAAAEGNETVRVTLSNPTGGAALGNAIATITIQDDDSGGAAPTAPANLQAHVHSTTEIMLMWTDSSGETGYRIERKTLGGAFEEVATAPANATSAVVGGLEEATFYTFRIRAENGAGVSGYSNEAGAATNATPGPCAISSSVLCLNDGRFRVELVWRSATGGGPANPVPLAFAPDSGLFFFVDPFNLEMLIKVLEACGINNQYWVFFAATTNVELILTVTDTQTGRVKVYFNPLDNPAAPVQDTNAFSCS